MRSSSVRPNRTPKESTYNRHNSPAPSSSINKFISQKIILKFNSIIALL